MGTSGNKKLLSDGHGIVDLQIGVILVSDMTGDLTSAYTVETTSVLCDLFPIGVVTNRLSVPSFAEKGNKACPYIEIGHHQKKRMARYRRASACLCNAIRDPDRGVAMAIWRKTLVIALFKWESSY